MDGRNREPAARYRIGRSLIAAGSRLLPSRRSLARLYRWMGSLSQQHQTRISRKSQKDCRTGTSLFSGVDGVVYCDRDQKREEQRGCGDHLQDDLGNPCKIAEIVSSVLWGK